MQELEAGTGALVFLGDLVQPDTEPYDEMDSFGIDDGLFCSSLKLKFSGRGVFPPGQSRQLLDRGVQGPRTAGRAVAQKARGVTRCMHYRKQMERFYDLCPVVALSEEFVACHAGPPLGKTKRDKIVNIIQQSSRSAA